RPGLRPGDAGPDADRRGDRMAAGRRDRRGNRPADVLAPVPRGLRAPAPGHPDSAVARMAGLGPSRAGPPLRGPGRPPAPARRPRQRPGMGRVRRRSLPGGCVADQDRSSVLVVMTTQTDEQSAPISLLPVSPRREENSSVRGRPWSRTGWRLVLFLDGPDDRPQQRRQLVLLVTGEAGADLGLAPVER